ncbi:FAD-dependent oxidoreductase [Klebsiella quasipneumoniae subsp. similipneumoniae]
MEDLNAIESCARRSKRGAVVGGGLLGLEAAGALKNLGVETHVIEFAPMLMAEQLDQMGGEQLRRKIESMGVKVHTSKNTKEIVQQGIEARKTMRFADGSELQVDFIVFSTGIRPRDKLATQSGWRLPSAAASWSTIAARPPTRIYAIGECASWNNRVYGLVAPGYKMAQVAVDHLLGSENSFTGADLSAKLKLLGVDVGGIGDAHGRTPGARSYVYLDESKEVHKRSIVSADNKPCSARCWSATPATTVTCCSWCSTPLSCRRIGFADPPGPPVAAANRRSASINCRTARKSAPALTSAKAT